MKHVFCVLVVWMFSGGLLKGQDVIEITDKTESHALANNLYIIQDDSRKLTIEDITNPKNQDKFHKINKKTPNLGFSTSNFWVKVPIYNNSMHTQWFLELDYPPMDSIELFYEVKNAGWFREVLGDRLPTSKRAVFYRNHVFELDLPVGNIQTFYIKVHTEGAIQLPLTLRNLHNFQKSVTTSDVVYGIFYGVFLIMFVYNLFIFFALRNMSYFYYCCYLVCYFLTQSTLNGHGTQFLWTQGGWWSQMSIPICMELGVVFATIFAMNFLYTKKFTPRLHRFLQIFAGLALLSFLLTAATDYNVGVKLATLTMMLSTIILLGSGVIVWRNGNKAALYYIIAWVALLIGLVLQVLMTFGALPSYSLVKYGGQYGAVLEVMFLSFALADRINVIRREKEKAQAESLEAAKENERIIREQNEILEHKVEERTIELKQKQEEILVQNEELHQQQEEIMAQRDFIEHKNKELAEVNMVMSQSIDYASHIQKTLLPKNEEILAHVKEFFVIYEPRDVVSGDFYWFSAVNNKVFFAAVDCTGHGVPGAFMSMIGNTLLNEIVNESHNYSPDKILELLHQGVIKGLRQAETGNSDGMDVCLCCIEKEGVNYKITYGGARRPLFIVNNAEFIELKGDRRSVGGLQYENMSPFENHEITVSEGASIYLSSDGLVDNPNMEREKFGIKRLKDLIMESQHLSKQEEKAHIYTALRNFQGEAKQRDDVLLLGVKL